MGFTPPPLNQLVNFLSASRKKRLIPAGLFSPGDNIGLGIWDIATTATPLVGTIDGVNAVFAAPLGFGTIYKNGVMQLLGTMYTVAGSNVTFIDPYIPQPGDYLAAI